MDMCTGSIFKKMVLFAIPLILSGMLQLMFNAADMMIAGKYVGSEALAAVGSTGSLINLIINVFMGFSVGSSVLVARYYGAKQFEDIRETIHTSIALALIFGVFLMCIGVAFAEPLLIMMGTPEDVLPGSAAYMKIYFIGLPVNLLYNFGSGILRAVGDTKRPLYFLTLAGVINVILNITFIRLFGMKVEGVALATVVSQAVSAALVIICLIRSEGAVKLEIKKIRVHRDKFFGMMKIGLPAGLQGAMFSISNVLIQSSINSFGKIAMAGNTAACNIEGFMNASSTAIHQSVLSFTSQNLGAGKLKRCRKSLFAGLLIVIAITLFMGSVFTLFAEELLGLYADSQIVIDWGLIRVSVMFMSYFLLGIMDVLVGAMRGLGKSLFPMIATVVGVCVFRIVWIYTVFKPVHDLKTLYYSYPISWAATSVVILTGYIVAYRRLEKNSAANTSQA